MKTQSTSTTIHTRMIRVARMLIGAVLMTAILGGILFIAAGRTDWIEAWRLISICDDLCPVNGTASQATHAPASHVTA